MKFLKESKKNFRWFPEDAIEKFLKFCGRGLKSIFLVGINTGLRISELLSLKWKQVDFDNCYITIEESKTDEYRDDYRKVKMNSVVINILKGLASMFSPVMMESLSSVSTSHFRMRASEPS